MTFFWVTFEDRKGGTVEVDGSWYTSWQHTNEEMETQREALMEDVRTRASAFGTVKRVERLPYPAEPRLDVRSECPSFCYSPAQCQGRGSCPKSYACSE